MNDRIAAEIWAVKTHEVEKDFPFLPELEEQFPKAVKALRRVWANERIVAERLEHKRRTNPNHQDGRAHNRLLRRQEKLNGKGKVLLNQLVFLAAIGREQAVAQESQGRPGSALSEDPVGDVVCGSGSDQSSASAGASDRLTQDDRVIASPVTDEDRQALLEEVREMYRAWTRNAYRYEWYDNHEPFDRSGALEMVPMADVPDFDEWLGEYTGEVLPSFMAGAGWDYPTFGNEVWNLAQAFVRDAYERRFGEEWQSDDELDNAACEDESALYNWVVAQLAHIDQQGDAKRNWKDEGF